MKKSTELTLWAGPQPTSSELGIDTPLSYLNDSWQVAVRLLDRGRRLYREGKTLIPSRPDQPGGFPGAWLPVSLGRRGPLVEIWDERDIRHAAKMIAYLWAEEPGLAEEYERNLFDDTRILANGDFVSHDRRVEPYSNHVTMYASAAADMPWCFGVTAGGRRRVLRNVVKLVRRTLDVFDSEKSGLLDVGVGPEWHMRGFWGTHLGEPAHFPANYDGRNKCVIAGMALAVFVKRFLDVAQELDAPEAKPLQLALTRLTDAIEGPAWNELTNYYYLQRDDNSNRWFHSMNGQCEESRETDVMPHYAAEIGAIPERVNAVGRVINHAILKELVFPMPTRWPAYPWYSPAHPNGVDMGEDSGQIGGAWDTPYFHCVQILERLGLQESVQRSVLRRAEVIHRDQDCLESYRLDGTVDHERFFNRDQYIVSATAHVSAIIEGLFGITPAKTGFAEVNLRPNLPLYRRYRHTSHVSDWSGRDNRICVNLGPRGRLEMIVRYDEPAETLTLRTSAVGIPAHIRLPLDLGDRFNNATWGGRPVKTRIEKGMDSDFILVDHVLDGSEFKVKLTPHPQQGKGTVAVNPEQAS